MLSLLHGFIFQVPTSHSVDRMVDLLGPWRVAILISCNWHFKMDDLLLKLFPNFYAKP